MKIRECFALLVLIIFTSMHSQLQILANEDLFDKVDGKEELTAIFVEDAPEDFCMEPVVPSNGLMACGKLRTNAKKYVCIGQCDVGFEFPNKETEGKITCNLTTNIWLPRSKFPDCEKKIICDPPCQNGGSCVNENVCSCRDGFTGKVCKQRLCTPPCQNGGTCLENNTCSCAPRFEGNECEKDICKEPPKPLNGKMRCSRLLTDLNRFVCAAKCEEGYVFPNGDKKKIHTCDSKAKTWTPSYEFPNCEDICKEPTKPLNGKMRCSKLPTDLNMFECTAECEEGYRFPNGDKKAKHTCDSKAKTWTPSYEFPNCEDICKKPPKPLNGKMRCSKLCTNLNKFVCRAKCEEGYHFPNGDEKANHTCDLKTKTWTPSYEFPNCEAKPSECKDGWTEYFNTDNPVSSDIGDDESLDRIKKRHPVCIGGVIKDIECKARMDRKLVDYNKVGTAGLECSKDVGFICNRTTRQNPCKDFTVRFLCDCGVHEPGRRPTFLPRHMCPEVPRHILNQCPPSCQRGFVCFEDACVPKDNCPCFKNGTNLTPTRSRWINEKCENCICRKGGNSRCKPMKCSGCIPGEISFIDSKCHCTCINCSENTVFCKETEECIEKELLCNGAAQCPGIQITCPTEVEI